MGGVSSVPAPPVRMVKYERISLAGTELPIPSSIQTVDLPPVITATALAGIRLVAGLRRHYVFPTNRPVEDADIEATESMLASLIADATKACNIRDYVTLLIEKTIMRLSMDLGPPTEDLLSVARFLNPFLLEAGASSAGLEPFRETDAALITPVERDLLVLLYYCHTRNIKVSADEAVRHMSSVAGRHGVIHDLDRRREPLTETEVYIFWTLTFLATNLAAEAPPLPPATTTLLNTELSTQLSRLLSTSEMLLKDHRLDQACFVLMFLGRLVAREDRGWWRPRAKGIQKMLERTCVPKQAWHVAFAERTVRGLYKGKDMGGLEVWAGRNSLSFSREELPGVDVLKGL